MNDLVGPLTLMDTTFRWAGTDELWALDATYLQGKELGRWRDPEQFFAYVADACEVHTKAAGLYAVANGARNSYGKHVLRIDGETYERPRGDFSFVKGDSTEVAKKFRSLVLEQLSAVTCSYTEEARRTQGDATSTIENSELWLPYREWRACLEPPDQVISFNYDTVVELIGGGRVHTVLPDSPVVTTQSNLFKLHGSVDWYEEHDRIVRTDDLGPAQGRGVAPFLAFPGREKMQQAARLEPVWEPALKALKRAEVVVFVGYRFPPTDNYANSRLLGAIRNNLNPNLRVFVALGPDDTAETRRMMRLLRLAIPRTKVAILNTGLYAQDLMIHCSRQMILDRRGDGWRVM
jgi:hypothetical protein